MFCKNCGKEIDDKACVCVFCGVATEQKPDVVEVKKANGLGIAGFVVALLSLWLGVYFCIASIVGLALSIAGMVAAKNRRLNGLAVAGLVISIFSLMIWGIIWIVMGAAILLM